MHVFLLALGETAGNICNIYPKYVPPRHGVLVRTAGPDCRPSEVLQLLRRDE